MKRLALYFTAPYRVSVQEESLAPPAADQVLVQTLVSAISPGTELLFYRGQAPTDLPVDETIAALPVRSAFRSSTMPPLDGSCSGRADCSRVARPPGLRHPHESRFLASWMS